MKRIMLIMLMCLMLVGCSKQDYGIFTKEGYDLLTETEREYAIKSYDNMISFIDCAKKNELDGIRKYSIKVKDDYSIAAMMIDVAMFNMQSYLSVDEYDVSKATAKYIIARDELSYYINEDSIEKISLTEEDIEIIKENLNKYY